MLGFTTYQSPLRIEELDPAKWKFQQGEKKLYKYGRWFIIAKTILMTSLVIVNDIIFNKKPLSLVSIAYTNI